MARYIATLGDYNLELRHLPGTKNHADALSRRPDYDQGEEDNDSVLALPMKLFAKAMSTITLDEKITKLQKERGDQIQEWKELYRLEEKEGKWWRRDALVVPTAIEI